MRSSSKPHYAAIVHQLERIGLHLADIHRSLTVFYAELTPASKAAEAGELLQQEMRQLENAMLSFNRAKAIMTDLDQN